METLEMKTTTIEEIMKEVYNSTSIYSQIIDNFINTNDDRLKSELLSEISINYVENKEKICKIWDEGYFKYYFINTVKNQVKSSTSSFFKNVRITYDIGEEEIDIIDDDSVDDIERKIEIENKLQLIKEKLNNLPISWFDRQMYIEYYENNKTYRQIEEEYTIDHVLVWKTVTRVIKMLKEEIK